MFLCNQQCNQGKLGTDMFYLSGGYPSCFKMHISCSESLSIEGWDKIFAGESLTISMEGLLYLSLKHLALANISNRRLDQMDCRSDLVWQFLCSCVLPPPGARAKLSGIMRKSLFRSPGKTVELAIKKSSFEKLRGFCTFY